MRLRQHPAHDCCTHSAQTEDKEMAGTLMVVCEDPDNTSSDVMLMRCSPIVVIVVRMKT